jgi:hypothetical protein
MHTTMAIVRICLGASKVLEDDVFALQKLKEEVQNDFERVELLVEDHLFHITKGEEKLSLL